MSYIPPHKRHTKDPDSPIVKPERPFGYNNVDRKNSQYSQPISIYAKDAVSTWFSVGLNDYDDGDDGQFSLSVRLEQTSLNAYEQKRYELPMILVLQKKGDGDGDGDDDTVCPVKYIVTRLEKDLINSFQNMRMLMEECPEVKPSMVVRFGKILFNGPSVPSTTLVTEASLKRRKKTFYTNLPPSYLKFVEDEAVDKIGLKLDAEKDTYQVKFVDRLQPKSSILCKCRIVENSNKLELYKMEMNQVRHFVADISCLGQKTDVRLMLYSKSTVTTLTVEEEKTLEKLISSAVLDPDIKGGLSWPLGGRSDGDRYTIVGVCHYKSKKFRNSLLRLKIREADRFDFESACGDFSGEVVLKMSQLASCLKDKNKVVDNFVSELLNDYVKVIWDILISSS